MSRSRISSQQAILALCGLSLCSHSHAWVASPCTRISSLTLHAKRSKNNRGDDDDLNRWYDDVGEDATPDKVFWEEMERQRLLNQVNSNGNGGSTATNGSSTNGSTPPMATAATSSPSPRNYNVPPPMSGFGGMYSGGGGNSGQENPNPAAGAAGAAA